MENHGLAKPAITTALAPSITFAARVLVQHRRLAGRE